MTVDINKYQYEENQKEKGIPSEYVMLEADLLSDTSLKESKEFKKTILIYSQSHSLLQEVSNTLKSALGPEVEVLSTFDNNVAIRLLQNSV